MQPKRLNKTVIGPRLTKCLVCGNLTARIESVKSSVGTLHRKLICYATNCRNEKNV